MSSMNIACLLLFLLIYIDSYNAILLFLCLQFYLVKRFIVKNSHVQHTWARCYQYRKSSPCVSLRNLLLAIPAFVCHTIDNSRISMITLLLHGSCYVYYNDFYLSHFISILLINVQMYWIILKIFPTITNIIHC